MTVETWTLRLGLAVLAVISSGCGEPATQGEPNAAGAGAAGGVPDGNAGSGAGGATATAGTGGTGGAEAGTAGTSGSGGVGGTQETGPPPFRRIVYGWLGNNANGEFRVVDLLDAGPTAPVTLVWEPDFLVDYDPPLGVVSPDRNWFLAAREVWMFSADGEGVDMRSPSRNAEYSSRWSADSMAVTFTSGAVTKLVRWLDSKWSVFPDMFDPFSAPSDRCYWQPGGTTHLLCVFPDRENVLWDLTNGTVSRDVGDHYAWWTADGSAFLSVQKRDGDFDLVWEHLETGDSVVLVTLPEFVPYSGWTPPGERYVHDSRWGCVDLPLADGAEYACPAGRVRGGSSDGLGVAYATGRTVEEIHVEYPGTAPYTGSYIEKDFVWPAQWSPTEPVFAYGHDCLYLVQMGATEPHVIRVGPGFPLSWSPDGRLLMYESDPLVHNTCGETGPVEHAIHVVNIVDGQVLAKHKLDDRPTEWGYYLESDWAPDSSGLVWSFGTQVNYAAFDEGSLTFGPVAIGGPSEDTLEENYPFFVRHRQP